jgi:uncharacterized Zn finger protein (UPF0148 family)
VAAKGAVGAAGAGAIASRVIEAGEGDAGTTECPSCHTPISISETDSDVICAGCGARYAIERTPKATDEVAAGRGKKK